MRSVKVQAPTRLILESAQDSISGRDATLAEREESLAATNQKLEVAHSEVNRLAQERDELTTET